LIAAVGLAIGMAWSGLLANLAAGGFIIVLRPFKVGDFVTAGGVTGTVTEIGLFVTAINTPDNVLTLIGNNKIFGDTIQNYSHNAFRRVDLTAQLAGSADWKGAAVLLRQRIAAIDKCAGDTGRRCRDPGVQSGRPGAGGTSLLPYRPLLAGLLRQQQGDQGCPG
jgi:small conductance mechanosensitive channel